MRLQRGFVWTLATLLLISACIDDDHVSSIAVCKIRATGANTPECRYDQIALLPMIELTTDDQAAQHAALRTAAVLP